MSSRPSRDRRLADLTNVSEEGRNSGVEISISKYLKPDTPVATNKVCDRSVASDSINTSGLEDIGAVKTFMAQASTPISADRFMKKPLGAIPMPVLSSLESCTISDESKKPDASKDSVRHHSSTFNDFTPPLATLPDPRVSEISPLEGKNLSEALKFTFPESKKSSLGKPSGTEKSFEVYTTNPEEALKKAEAEVRERNLLTGETPSDAPASLLTSQISANGDELDPDKIFAPLMDGVHLSSIFGSYSTSDDSKRAPQRPVAADTFSVSRASIASEKSGTSENLSGMWGAMVKKYQLGDKASTSGLSKKSEDDEKELDKTLTAPKDDTKETATLKPATSSAAASTCSSTSECGSSASATVCVPSDRNREPTPSELIIAALSRATSQASSGSIAGPSDSSLQQQQMQQLLPNWASQMMQSQALYVFPGYPTESILEVQLGFMCLHAPKNCLLSVFNSSFFNQRYSILETSFSVDGVDVSLPSRSVMIQKPSSIDAQPLKPSPVQIIVTCHQIGEIELTLTISGGSYVTTNYKVIIKGTVVWPTVKFGLPEPFVSVSGTNRSDVTSRDITLSGSAITHTSEVAGDGYCTSVDVRNCSGCMVPLEIHVKGETSLANFSFTASNILLKKRLSIPANMTLVVKVYAFKKTAGLNLPAGSIRARLRAYVDVEGVDRDQNAVAIRNLSL